MQVTVMDEGGLVSNRSLTTLTIQLLDDEPPRFISTPFNQTYTEQGGPIPILGNSVAIVDNDNCPEGRNVVRLTVELLSPLPEDILLMNRLRVDYALEFNCSAQPSCYVDYLEDYHWWE